MEHAFNCIQLNKTRLCGTQIRLSPIRFDATGSTIIRLSKIFRAGLNPISDFNPESVFNSKTHPEIIYGANYPQII